MPETGFGGMGYGTTGAHCATHPDQLATRTCTRCGSFMCATCAEGGARTLCPACQQRLGVGQRFPFNRGNWSFSALWDYSFELFKREWVMLSVGVLVFFGISMMVQLLANILPAAASVLENQALSVVLTFVAVFVQNLVQGVLGLGLMRMLFDVLQGGKADIGRLFSQIHKAGTYLVTMLLLVLMIGLPIGALAGGIFGLTTVVDRDALPLVLGIVFVLSLVPLTYFLLPLALLQYEIAYNDGATPMQMIRNCYAYARDERLSIFGISFVAGLVMMAGVLACCVGVFPGMGLGYLLLAGLYLALRNGADVER